VRGANYAEAGRLRDYVLDDFEDSELPIFNRTIDRALDALVLFARGDLKRAMNTFNRDPDEESDSEPSETP
jgi:peptidyl-tRNA hydrolase